MAVEVNLDKENLEDAWFPATVLEEVGFNSFLLDCGSSNGHIKETVDCFHIRPPPPKLDITEFEILEAVDVFHESSWREALIIKILTEGRYSVSLKHAEKEMQLSQSEIRPHLSLMDGVWVNLARVFHLPSMFFYIKLQLDVECSLLYYSHSLLERLSRKIACLQVCSHYYDRYVLIHHWH